MSPVCFRIADPRRAILSDRPHAHLGADSLDTVELVMALEEEFEIDIPDEEAEKIVTFQDVINYIKAHTNQTT